MIVFTFLCGLVALFAGYLTDDGPVIIGGFFLVLIGTACLLDRDGERNASAILHEREQRDAEWKRRAA